MFNSLPSSRLVDSISIYNQVGFRYHMKINQFYNKITLLFDLRLLLYSTNYI